MEKETKESQDKRVAGTQNTRNLPYNNAIDLQELFWVILARWKAILVAMLAGALLFGAYHTFLMKPVYQADASIFITNTNSMITISDLQLSSALTEDYAKIIKSRTVLKQVIEDMDLDMNFKQLSNLVSVTNPSDSHIITITVTCSDMELSRNIANSLMNVGIDRIYQVIGSSEPTVIDYSEAEAVTEISAGLLHYIEMGALLGAVLVCALIVLRFLTDTTLKSEDDLRNYLHMPVLAVVPYYDEKKG
jgi:capsular polysaccharide biosynthesis protein